MEKFISNKTFDQLTDKLIDFMNMLNEVKGITELNPRILAILKEYGKPADGSDEEILLRYETWYDKLDEFAIKKIKIKVTLNDLVDKIIEKKTILHKNKMKQLDNTMKKHCDTIEATYAKDKEILENIVPSINKLKEWSDKQKCSVIFDSKLDGDGENNGFMNKVMNKQNLYFISFDNQNNVFGGYADNNINITDGSRTNPNAFTFSLIRNGNLENMKYNIKKEQENCAFSFLL
ncbi:TLDc domain-containing protein [Entamoeba marina]